MYDLDRRNPLPETPGFHADMERFLVSAVDRDPRQSPRPQRLVIAVASTAAMFAVAVTIGAVVVSRGTTRAARGIEVGAVHVHLADFSVDTHPGGTVTVTLSDSQLHDPEALRRALAQADIPARITIRSFCYNAVQNRRALDQAVVPYPGDAFDVVITPSKLPAGSTLAIGYAQPPGGGPLKPFLSLLSAGAPVTCSAQPPHPLKGPSTIGGNR
jgi:hypothetical protein